MSNIALLSCMLRHNGVDYPAGSIISVPDDVAARLVADNPGVIDAVDATSPVADTPEEAERLAAAEEAAGLPDFDAMTVAELKGWAEVHNIALKSARTKADIIEVFQRIYGVDSASGAEDGAELPPVDVEATVK